MARSQTTSYTPRSSRATVPRISAPVVRGEIVDIHTAPARSGRRKGKRRRGSNSESLTTFLSGPTAEIGVAVIGGELAEAALGKLLGGKVGGFLRHVIEIGAGYYLARGRDAKSWMRWIGTGLALRGAAAIVLGSSSDSSSADSSSKGKGFGLADLFRGGIIDLGGSDDAAKPSPHAAATGGIGGAAARASWANSLTPDQRAAARANAQALLDVLA